MSSITTLSTSMERRLKMWRTQPLRHLQMSGFLLEIISNLLLMRLTKTLSGKTEVHNTELLSSWLEFLENRFCFV